MSRRVEQIRFVGSEGAELAGRFDRPAGPPKATALFAHCFTCSKDTRAASRLAAELNAQGIAVLRFDFTGLGASEGDFANTDFSSNVEDLRRAADWLRDNASAPQLLIGHSLGGSAVLAVARDVPERRAVITIGAPADAAHVTRLFADDVATITDEGQATVSIAGRPFTIRRSFLDDLAAQSPTECARRLGAALLVVHAPLDNTVGIDNAARIYEAARHPKSFLSLDGADHLLTNADDAVYAARMIATWAERYVVNEHPLEPEPRAGSSVVAAEAGQGKFLTQIVAGGARFLADEPESYGGFGAGPTPYDLLSAALGACTSMTLRLYADRKHMDLERVVVSVKHGKVHVDDLIDEVMADGEARPAADPFVYHFERTLTLHGDLSPTEREDLVRIADRCPVHRTLESGGRVSTRLAE